MKKHEATRGLYELKPYLIIISGFFGVFNSMVAPGTPLLNHVAEFCGVILFAAGAKILQWRRNYRQRWL